MGRRRVLHATVAVLTALPYVADMVTGWLGWKIFFLGDAKLQFIWTTGVLLWGALPLVRRDRSPALLGALGVAAVAYGYSAFHTFRTGEVAAPMPGLHYGTAAGLVALAALFRLAGGRPQG